MLFPGVEAQEFSAFTIFFMIFSFPSLPHLLLFLFLSFLPYCLFLFLSFATHTYREKQWHEHCFIALAKAVNLPWAWGAKAVYTREQQAHLPGAQHPVGRIGTLERWEGSEAKPSPPKNLKTLFSISQVNITVYAWMKLSLCSMLTHYDRTQNVGVSHFL